MDKSQVKISVKDLTEEISLLINDEIVATYTEEDDALQVHFFNGQNFRDRTSWGQRLLCR